MVGVLSLQVQTVHGYVSWVVHGTHKFAYAVVTTHTKEDAGTTVVESNSLQVAMQICYSLISTVINFHIPNP
jgi:hypothetical protein